MAFGRRNHVKLDPFSYNIGILGEGGVGKTTLIYQMCEKYLPKDGYLFLECGKEDGEEAIEGINSVKIVSWDEPLERYDENEAGFSEVIDDILENKTTEYPNLKVVVVDTYDQLLKITEPEVIAMHNRENPDKKTTSIKAAFGGFMAGEDKCDDIILDKLWELKKVGVHFIIIGHVAKKDKDDPITGLSYSQISANIGNRHFNAIKTKLHFCGVCYVDRDIIAKKTGKKNIVTKKEEIKGQITGEARKIVFRDDNYSVDSKCRFAQITNEKLDLNPDVVYNAMLDAIKAEQAKSGKSFEETAKEQEKQEAERLKQIQQKEKEMKEQKEVKEIVEELKQIAINNKANKDFIPQFTQIIKEYKLKGFEEINDLKTAKAVYKKVKAI